MDKITKVSEEEFYDFLNLLSKLNAIEFIGVATWLEVPCFNDIEHKEARSTEELMSDIMDAYLQTSHTKRKQILKMMKQAVKARLRKK